MNTLVSSDPIGHEESSKLEERVWEEGTNTLTAAKLLCILALLKVTVYCHGGSQREGGKGSISLCFFFSSLSDMCVIH